MNTLNHLAIIADGNGRWAELQGLDRKEGHRIGLEKAEEIVQWCYRSNIKVLSLYLFSLDNWKRPEDEINNLRSLADNYVTNYRVFKDNNIKFLISGSVDNLDEEAIEKIHFMQEETKNCNGLILNICANYNGHKEIVDAIAKGARTEEEITAHLYQNLPFPDLILRTGGYQRLSGFLTWQSAYSELAFTHTLFPDLTISELNHIKKQFEQETRNFGGVIVDKRTVCLSTTP